MSRKGENIYKRKDGRWEGRYIKFYERLGKAKYGYVYGRTYNETKQKLLEQKAKPTEMLGTSPKNNTPYSSVLDSWLQTARISTKESTFARYKRLVDQHISPSLGQYPISKISTQLIESFVAEKLDNGRLDGCGGLSSKTVADILSIVKSSIEYARYENFAVICNLGKLTIKKREHEMRVLTAAEQKALLEVLFDDIDRYKLGVLLSLYTGIRIGELCALQWEDLNFETSTLKIRKTMQRISDTNNGAMSKTKIIITEPKSKKSTRDIPLPTSLRKILEQFSCSPKAYILSGKQDAFVEPRTMQNHFKRFVSASGITDINFHALRHTFATRCIELGFDVKSLSEILGHSNVNITLNRYVHSSFELKISNMNKLTVLR